jgi:hypothetical protein
MTDDRKMVVENAHLSFARETLRTFMDAVAQMRAISAVEDHPYLLTVAQRNAYDTAINSWCILFGSDHADRQQIHWKNMFDNDPFRADLLRSLDMSQEAWGAYRKSLVDYRNELTAHRDLNPVSRHHPSFDAALRAANLFDEQLRVKIEKETGRKTAGPSLLDEFEERLQNFSQQAAKGSAAMNR